MIVQCPACSARYRIRDANIPPSGGKIRCPSCGHSFVVYPEVSEPPQDRTSITSPNAIKDLVSNMAPRTEEQEPKTEVVQGADLDRIRQMQNFQAPDDVGEDGTVEIKNPMEFWEKLQVERAKEAAPVEPEEEEYDTAATEIVSADSIHLPFTTGGPAIPPPSTSGPNIPPPSSSGLPTPAFPGARPVPSIPRPPLPTYGHDSTRETDSPVAAPSPITAPPVPATTPDLMAVPAHLSGPPVSAPVLPSPVVQPPKPAEMPEPMVPPPSFGFPGSSSDDIMAAIEEVSQAHEVEAAPFPQPGPSLDPNHDGPWKLKTNFGLTYEFPDTKSLNGWLGSRDELDGYMVAADNDTFVSLDSFPQLNLSAASSSPQQIASSGLYTQPAALPPSEVSQPFAAPTFTPPSPSGSFQAMPDPVPVERQKVNTEYRPPSQGAKWNKVLWLVFLLLLMICGAVAVQTFEIFDIVGAVKGTSQSIKKLTPDKPISPDTVVVVPEEDTSVRDVARVLKDARREVKNNRMQSALDRLQTVEALEPDNIEMHELLGQIYGALGQESKAQSAIEKVAELKAALKENEAIADESKDLGADSAEDSPTENKDTEPANPN